jgi:hypothetical protein
MKILQWTFLISTKKLSLTFFKRTFRISFQMGRPKGASQPAKPRAKPPAKKVKPVVDGDLGPRESRADWDFNQSSQNKRKQRPLIDDPDDSSNSQGSNNINGDHHSKKGRTDAPSTSSQQVNNFT